MNSKQKLEEKLWNIFRLQLTVMYSILLLTTTQYRVMIYIDLPLALQLIVAAPPRSQSYRAASLQRDIIIACCRLPPAQPSSPGCKSTFTFVEARFATTLSYLWLAAREQFGMIFCCYFHGLSSLDQVMAGCRQTTSHYMINGWRRPSRCQRCLVPRSAETPLVKGTVIFYVENFRRVTALSKCKSISIKIGLCILGCMNYKTAYSLKQFLPPMPKMATLKTATTRLFTSLCF